MVGLRISILSLLFVFCLVIPSWSYNNETKVTDIDQTNIGDNNDDKINNKQRNAGENTGRTRLENKGQKYKNRNKKEKKLEKKYKKKNKNGSKKNEKGSTRMGSCSGTTSDWSCCSSSSPCQENEGDCDNNSECAGSLVCGKDNCQNINPLAHRLADCCVHPCAGGSSDWSCCSSTSPCQAAQGDCDYDSDCAGSLICGYNNCQKFNPFAHALADCCINPNVKEICEFNDMELSSNTRNPVEIHKGYTWSNGIIPYYFKDLVSTKDKDLIEKAMGQIEAKTCFRFDNMGSNPTRTHHLEITVGSPKCWENGFNAYVTADYYPVMKMVSKYQLNDESRCNYEGAVLHELMHALGIAHTQRRVDRDNYINVHPQNIEDYGQYEICQGCKQYDIPYDCDSIMHYGFTTARTDAAKKNGLPTMTAKNPKSCKLTAQGPSFTGKREATSTDWDLLSIISIKMCGCPSGWTFLATGCYKFIDSVTYQEGATKCKQDGGYLAEITSQEEQDALWQFYQDSGLPLNWVWGVSSVWIGANDLAKDGDWRWAKSGRKMTYNAWYNSEPNGGTKENCAQAWGHINFKWNDLYCDYRIKALCETDSSIEKIATACEWENPPNGGSHMVAGQANLNCQYYGTGKIKITHVLYGRQDRSTCIPSWVDTKPFSFSCSADDAITKVKLLCEGRESCSVAASNGYFGYPCYGTWKYLTITYSCQGQAMPLPIG